MRFLCFGDSNTYGYDPRSFFGEQYEHPWPALVQELTGWEVINAGQNGREIPHTPWQLQQFEAVVSCYGTIDRLCVMLGGNDLLQNEHFTAKDVAKRMEGFLRLLCGRFPSSALLLAAPRPMEPGTWVREERLVRESALLGTEYKAVAEKLGVPFVDCADWGVESVYDGVHFSEAGHQAFARGILTALQEV